MANLEISKRVFRSVLLPFVSLSLMNPALRQENHSTTTIRLDLYQPLQIQIGHHSWRGPEDSSLFLNIQIQEKNLIITGSLYDDFPFIQPRKNPINLESRVIEYDADGIRYIGGTIWSEEEAG